MYKHRTTFPSCSTEALWHPGLHQLWCSQQGRELIVPFVSRGEAALFAFNRGLTSEMLRNALSQEEMADHWRQSLTTPLEWQCSESAFT